jgi:hypothetical protein
MNCEIPDLITARERGYLSMRGDDRPLRLAWTDYCDQAQRPLILVKRRGANATVEYDLIFLGQDGAATPTMLRALASLINNVMNDGALPYGQRAGYSLQCVVGKTTYLWISDAEKVGEAMVEIFVARDRP